MDQICTTLDKLCLDTLTSLEHHIQMKLSLEDAMTSGENHLAKTRYIAGQNSVSTMQIPSDGTTDAKYRAHASITLHCDADGTTNHRTLKLRNGTQNSTIVDDDDNNSEGSENSMDPIRWFGYLVPRNLRYAQLAYQQALEWIVNIADGQQRINTLCRYMNILETAKNQYSTTKMMDDIEE